MENKIEFGVNDSYKELVLGLADKKVIDKDLLEKELELVKYAIDKFSVAFAQAMANKMAEESKRREKPTPVFGRTSEKK